MLDFLRRWLLNRSRDIFRYWDGVRSRKADPIVICRMLESDPEFDWESHPALIHAAIAEDASKFTCTVADDALRISACAIRSAFGVPGVDDGGLTELECLELLATFTDYLGVQKKSGNPTLTSPEPTAWPSSDGSATNASSDSG